MKTEKEYIKDLSEIRSMMERSSKFLSLTGWSGILAGIYALAGTYLAYAHLGFTPAVDFSEFSPVTFSRLALLGLIILILAIGTALLLSRKKAQKNGEKLWNPVTGRLVINMAIPLVTGGVFISILFLKDLYILAVPATLIFYGLALLNAGKFTFDEVKSLGIIQTSLGLIAAYFTGYAFLIWALGFGVMHIVYGIYMHLKYEK